MRFLTTSLARRRKRALQRRAEQEQPQGRHARVEPPARRSRKSAAFHRVASAIGVLAGVGLLIGGAWLSWQAFTTDGDKPDAEAAGFVVGIGALLTSVGVHGLRKRVVAPSTPTAYHRRGSK